MDETDAALIKAKIGAPDWEPIWELAIKMPLNSDQFVGGRQRTLGARSGAYIRALGLLFQHDPDNKEFRRPTRLMHAALLWLRQQPTLVWVKADLINKSRSPTQKGLKCTEMPFLDINLPDGTCVMIASRPVSAREFGDFDPCYAAKHQNSDAPATDVSWFDAYCFTLAMGACDRNGRTFVVAMVKPEDLLKCINLCKYQLRGGSPGGAHNDDDSFVANVPANIFLNFGDSRPLGKSSDADPLGLTGLFSSGFEWSADVEREHDNAMAKAWRHFPNEYVVVPALRPPGGRYSNVTFRISLRRTEQ